MKGVLWQKLPQARHFLLTAVSCALASSVLLTGCGGYSPAGDASRSEAAYSSAGAYPPGAAHSARTLPPGSRQADASAAAGAPGASASAAAQPGAQASQAAAATAAATAAANAANAPGGVRRAESGSAAKAGRPAAQAASGANAASPNRTSPQDTQTGNRYNDTYFDSAGVNPFIYTDEEPVSTFAVDVDTASYSISRNYILNGSLPPPEAVRPEEFINYFRREYQPPRSDTFSIYTEMAPSYFDRGCHLIEIGLQGKTVPEEVRKDASLTFVIDVSGSMAREDRLSLVKESLRKLVGRMYNTDRIGIAVYGTKGRKLLSHTPGSNRRKILSAIGSLQPEGSTNAAEGLQIGYEMASDAFIKGAINRVILCTDGVANEGVTDPDAILRMTEDYRGQGVTLTCLGFGMSNYNDDLLETLADKGDGNYSYIDSPEEAEKVFSDNLTGTLQVIAKDVKTQVEFDPGLVESYRLIGYEDRALNEEDFRNNSVDAGEVGAGHSVTALYEVRLREGYTGDVGTVRVRYQDPDTGKVSEIYKRITTWDIKARVEDSTPRFRFLTAVAETSEIMRDSYWARGVSYKDVLGLIGSLSRDFTPNASDNEFIDLVERASELEHRH